MLTDNNGLMMTADILEEIYTNAAFPKGTRKLKDSLKNMGKSRADLWAFAATVALEKGIQNNNDYCDRHPGDGCGHLQAGKKDCKIKWSRPIKFQTGRKDCVSKSGANRSYFAAKHETHPNVHDNGPGTVNFYKNSFGFTARQAIAITGGAHTFGKFNSNISLFRYFWTRAQESILNNQLFRHYL